MVSGVKASAKGINAATDAKNVTKNLPALDHADKVHGELPSAKDLDKYDTGDLKQLKGELEQSVQERISKSDELGRDKAHGQRQGAEQGLIKSIDKRLKDHE